MSLLSELKERNREPETTDPGFYDNEMDQVIHELDQAGVYIMDVPAAKRHEASILDEKLTQAANENRREDFLRLLIEWRNCFH